MALSSTIFKFEIQLSDLNRHIYQVLQLTLAQHPSETAERLLVRVLAFCLNYDSELRFTKGLSTPDEPDIDQRSLDGVLQCWIDVGEPKFERIKKASRQAKQTKVYAFNSKADVWWRQVAKDFSKLNVEVACFNWAEIELAAAQLTRSMSFAITISEGDILMATDQGAYSFNITTLDV